MKTLKNPLTYIVFMFILFLALLTNYMNLREELNRCKTDTYYVPGGDIEKSELLVKIDSLEQEMFICKIQLGSYETMWNILEDVNRPLADSINLQVE